MVAVVEKLRQNDTTSVPNHDEDKGKPQVISNDEEDLDCLPIQNGRKNPSMDEGIQIAVKDFVAKNKICPLENGLFDISYFASLQGDKLPIHISEPLLQDIVDIPQSLHNYHNSNQRLEWMVTRVIAAKQATSESNPKTSQFEAYIPLGVGKNAKEKYPPYPMVVFVKEDAAGETYLEVRKESELAKSAAIQQAKTRKRGHNPPFRKNLA